MSVLKSSWCPIGQVGEGVLDIANDNMTYHRLRGILEFAEKAATLWAIRATFCLDTLLPMFLNLEDRSRNRYLDGKTLGAVQLDISNELAQRRRGVLLEIIDELRGLGACETIDTLVIEFADVQHPDTCRFETNRGR